MNIVFLTVLLAFSSIPSPSSVDVSLGGLAAGIDSDEKARELFGARIREESGILVASPGVACELRIYAEEGVIISLTLQRLGKEVQECLSIKTSKGITLESTVEDVKKIYGLPAFEKTTESSVLVAYDNMRLCEVQDVKEIVLKILEVEWQSGQLARITVSAETLRCELLNEKELIGSNRRDE